MRMWMLSSPEIYCKAHILGSHVELHMLVGHLKRQRSIEGYIEHNCVEVSCIEEQHDLISREMIKRGYHHNSPIETPDISYLPIEHQIFQINTHKSLAELLTRCPLCLERFRALMKEVVAQ